MVFSCEHQTFQYGHLNREGRPSHTITLNKYFTTNELQYRLTDEQADSISSVSLGLISAV